MPHAPDLSGTALDDRYELHALIGEGAYGRVYEGRDRRLARPVAVKVIKPWWAEDPEWVAAFERETQLLARVSDPGIVQIFDVGQAPQGLYYVAELVDGESLASRLRRGPLPPWQACGVAAQLCRALARAHGERIVHRDVKPANILISAQGRVKVGDFGVARLAEGSSDGAAATVVGTPRYMAPEQGMGRATTPATDVYSVGVVLFEMLSGSPPFAGETVVELALRHLHDPPPPLSPQLPESLVAITEKALAKDPAERYADGGEMADALMDARRRSPSGRRSRLAPTRPHARPAVSRRPAASQSEGPQSSAAHNGVSHNGTAHSGIAHNGAAHNNTAHNGVAHNSAAQSGGGVAMAPHPQAPIDSRGRGEHKPPPPRRPDDTRPAVTSPRRNVNPAARRRAIAALGSVVALLAAMVAAAIVLAPGRHTQVPVLTELRRAAVIGAARRAHLNVGFGRRYDAAAAAGTAISQSPSAGARVKDGTRVTVVLSRGPAPVKLPNVDGQSERDARQSLTSLGLRAATRATPAPGTTPGTVTGQTLAGGTMITPGHTVTLLVAEVPRWRPLQAFSASRSGVFHIAGSHWRLAYEMSFQGTCTWIFWCSGPSARVIDAGSGRIVSQFGLQDGGRHVQPLTTPPGNYEIEIRAGGDDARWSIQPQDYY